MADDGFVDIKLEGLDELRKMLDDLSEKEADRIIRKALRAGGAIQKDAVQSFAPIRPDLPSTTALPPNALENDIILRVTKTDKDNFSAIIGPGKLTRHVAGWVEYGHRMVFPVKGGWSRLLTKGKNAGKTIGPGSQMRGKDGKLLVVPAHPFIRPAFESVVEQVTTLIAFVVKSEITKAASKK